MLTLIEDVAQKENKHIAKNEYFKRKGIEVIRHPLPVGDYVVATPQIQEMLDRKMKRGMAPKKMDFVGLYDRCVDSKSSIGEIYSDLIQDHGRFRDEAEFAKQRDIKLTILVEEPGIYRLDDVRRWKNPRMQRYEKIKSMHNQGKWKKIPEKKPPVNGEQLWKIMYTFAERHGVMWRFTSPQNAGRAVMYLLTGEDYGA